MAAFRRLRRQSTHADCASGAVGLRRASSLKLASSPALRFLPRPNVEAMLAALAAEHRLKTLLAAAKAPDADPKAVQKAFELLMDSKRGRSWFLSFLASEYADENLTFWMAAQDFHRMVQRCEEREAQLPNGDLSAYDNVPEEDEEQADDQPTASTVCLDAASSSSDRTLTDSSARDEALEGSSSTSRLEASKGGSEDLAALPSASMELPVTPGGAKRNSAFELETTTSAPVLLRKGLSCGAQREEEEESPREGAEESWSLARRIVADHLTTNAALEVNVSAIIRGRIELTLATSPATDRLPSDLFQEAQRHVYELMEREPFRRFLRSDYLRQRLAEPLPQPPGFPLPDQPSSSTAQS